MTEAVLAASARWGCPAAQVHAERFGLAESLRPMSSAASRRHKEVQDNTDEYSHGRTAMQTPPIVTPEEWEAARQQLLIKEKELTRARTRSPPSAGGCRGWRWRRSTRSTDRRAG